VNGSPPPKKKKNLQILLFEKPVPLNFQMLLTKTTEGSGVHGHVIRGTNVRCTLTVSSTNTLSLISGYPDVFSCPPTTNPNELHCCYMSNDTSDHSNDATCLKTENTCELYYRSVRFESRPVHLLIQFFLRGFTRTTYFEIVDRSLCGRR